MQKLDLMSLVYKASIDKYLKAVLIRMIHVGKLGQGGIEDVFIRIETLAVDLATSVPSINRALAEGRKFNVLINNKGHKYGKNNFSISLDALQMLVDNQGITTVKEIEPITEICSAYHRDMPEPITEIRKQGTRNKAFMDPCSMKDTTSVDKYEEPCSVSYEDVIRKLNFMRRDGQIYGHQAQKSIDTLAAEIIYHIGHRDKSKTRDDIHAFNAATRLIKNGKWKTPHGMIGAKLNHDEPTLNNQLNVGNINFNYLIGAGNK